MSKKLKGLLELRAEKVKEMETLLSVKDEEERALTEEESSKFDELEKEVTGIDDTIEKEKKLEALIDKKPAPTKSEDDEKKEERAFAEYIRGIATEQRANMTKGDNGDVIPTTIAKKIISKVYDISPVYQLADRYNVKGDLSIPYYDESTQSIGMSYADEFTDPSSTVGKLKTIDLSGYLARTLSLISKSLVNNSNFDIVGFVVEKMAEAIARFIEKETINGTSGKVTGLLVGTTQTITAASETAVTADELIDVQELIPDTYKNCIWIMNRTTRTAIRKLKDSDGNYLLNRDVSAKWGYTLLGKDVYTTESMSKMEAEADAIVYGDMTGLALKLSEAINITILKEKYAEQHAIGVVGFVEFDSKVENAQKIAKLTMAEEVTGS